MGSEGSETDGCSTAAPSEIYCWLGELLSSVVLRAELELCEPMSSVKLCAELEYVEAPAAAPAAELEATEALSATVG